MEIPTSCIVLIITIVLLVLRSEGKEKRILLNDPDLINSQIEALKREVQALTSQLSNVQTTYQSKITSLENKILQNNHGGTYIIWGRKTCPILNGTTTVYSGISGGRQYTVSGSGTNTLCLPHDPDATPSDYPTAFQSSDAWGSIYGAEYQFTYRRIAIDDDVPCAVCLLTHASSAIMIPAKTTCPTGWNIQYSGVLTSGSHEASHYGTDYLCLDGNPEYTTEGARMKNYNGKLFYPVRAVCGSLPCPPYTSQQLVSCVVCSI